MNYPILCLEQLQNNSKRKAKRMYHMILNCHCLASSKIDKSTTASLLTKLNPILFIPRRPSSHSEPPLSHFIENELLKIVELVVPLVQCSIPRRSLLILIQFQDPGDLINPSLDGVV